MTYWKYSSLMMGTLIPNYNNSFRIKLSINPLAQQILCWIQKLNHISRKEQYKVTQWYSRGYVLLTSTPVIIFETCAYKNDLYEIVNRYMQRMLRCKRDLFAKGVKGLMGKGDKRNKLNEWRVGWEGEVF